MGGIFFGFILGFIAHLLISATDDGSLEMLLTLTIPTAGFMLANMLHVSGALAMVVAGILIGNWIRHVSFSKQSRLYLDHFWEMIDHFLNSLLFLLIDLALLLVDFTYQGVILLILVVLICLAGRYISVWLPFRIMQRFRSYNPYRLKILTWGGLSLAMALSIPKDTLFIQHIGMDVRD